MALLPVAPWSRVDVVVDILHGYVVIWSAEGEWLGSWPASKVETEKEYTSRVLLTLGKEEIRLELDDPDSFVAAIEDEVRRVRDMTIRERMKGVAVIRTLPIRGRDSAIETGQIAAQNTSSPINRPARSTPSPIISDTHARIPERGLVAKRATAPSSQKDQELRSLMQSAQRDVVEALLSGLDAWFGFYFRTAHRTGQQRLDAATIGLRDASERLRDISLRIGASAEPGTPEQKDIVDTYRMTTEDWSEAMDRLASGIELDQQHVAESGFDLLSGAAEAARSINSSSNDSDKSPMVLYALEHLGGLNPPGRASSKAVKAAKRPWHNAIVEAGAPLNWPNS